MIKFILDWWHSRQRQIDLEILWPSCKKLAHDLDHAKMAFAVHAFSDRAWLCFGEDEIHRRINELK